MPTYSKRSSLALHCVVHHEHVFACRLKLYGADLPLEGEAL